MKEINLVPESNKCCGCGTCKLVCPTNAITMVPGELGCLYPKIDSNKCIQCHACEKVCAFGKEQEKQNAEPKVYAAAAKDQTVLKQSASGGVFAAVAHGILDAGGIVYGCALEMENEELTPVHIGIKCHEDVEKLQGSKYVQSSLGTVFVEIKKHLQQGRLVLFSGTPCQVHALKHYLKNTDTCNLYTMDLICHGVPSIAMFQGYLKNLAKEKRGKITGFSFRDKSRGWGLNACCCIEKSEGTKKVQSIPTGVSSYYSLFLQSEIYRESCYSCPYANADRVGDITIGDFWGFEQEHPEQLSENGGRFQVYKGISAVLVNNEQGHRLLAEYWQEMNLFESKVECVSKWNRQLRSPSKHSLFREEVKSNFDKTGYLGVERLFRKRLGLRYILRIVKFKLQNR